jgi:hypothetical protein
MNFLNGGGRLALSIAAALFAVAVSKFWLPRPVAE